MNKVLEIGSNYLGSESSTRLIEDLNLFYDVLNIKPDSKYVTRSSPVMSHNENKPYDKTKRKKLRLKNRARRKNRKRNRKK